MIEILKRPIVTEKMTALQEKGQYAFEVALHGEQDRDRPGGGKEVQRHRRRCPHAAAQGEDEDPDDPERDGSPAGPRRGKRPIVRLKEGDKIEFFQNV